MKKLLTFLMIVCLMLSVLINVHAEDIALSLNRDSLTLSVGRYVTVYSYVSPSGAMRNHVTFSVSDESIASVNQEGKVRGLKVGECTLTATSKYDKNISVTIPVWVVIPVERVYIIAEQSGIVLGDTLQLSVAFEPQDATMQNVVYSSSDEAVAFVTQDGLVTGVKRGQVIITAETADGRDTDTIRITVKQPPESVTVSPDTLTIAEGRSERLSASVLPANADDKTVIWSSADDSIATVSDRGTVTGVQIGETVITVTCKDNENATFDIPVTVLKLASSVAFDQESYDIVLGESLQLTHLVSPANTSDQSVTYQVNNPRIATVDNNGVVTALKGGKTTVTLTTADGSKRKGTAAIRVLVPVTGVSYPRTDIRVGQGYYGHFTVNLAPSDASNNNMSWVIGDERIATVTGDTNTFKIVGGENWGRTIVSGITEDGGYPITLNVNVGSLRRAVTARTLEIKDGKPYITLENNSGIVITQVRYFMQGLDSAKNHITMSLTGDPLTLYGTYDLPLNPGERTQHGMFMFISPSNYPDLTYLCLVVTGWSTSTGYYDSNGILQYDYPIPESYQELVVYPTGTDPIIFQ